MVVVSFLVLGPLYYKKTRLQFAYCSYFLAPFSPLTLNPKFIFFIPPINKLMSCISKSIYDGFNLKSIIVAKTLNSIKMK